MTATWSPQVVEELLFRQYIKGEDVSMLLPPPPVLKTDRYMDVYDQSTKVLFSYVRNGPTAALSSYNVNTASKLCNTTPIKPQPFARVANQAQATQAAASASAVADVKAAGGRTPKAKENGGAMNSPIPLAAASPAARQGSAPLLADPRKNKTEWPPAVPTNASLKSTSRSKVAHLTAKRVAAQEEVDPDIIFAQNSGELPLHVIFANFPKALQSLAAVRSASGDWRSDTFAVDEENQYKRDLGYKYVGPSQCMYGRAKLFQK